MHELVRWGREFGGACRVGSGGIGTSGIGTSGIGVGCAFEQRRLLSPS